MSTEARSTGGRLPVSRAELIALLAMLMATVAFATDAMLPAFPAIAEDVAAGDAGRVALIVVTFMVGMGLGTLFAGPLSDAYGRQPVALGGAAIYVTAALAGALAQSLEALLVIRFFQGIGASGPRIVAMAIVRDLFSGRQMARTTSLVVTVFAIVPVLAPSLGAAIDWAFGWRAIFVSFAIFSALSVLWLKLRLDETHPVEKRRPFRLGMLRKGIFEIAGNAMVRRAVAAQILVYTVLFTCLMSSQPIFDEYFGRATSYPLWFGLTALLSAGASFVNASIVVRTGMPTVIRSALIGTALYTGFYLLVMPLATDGGSVEFVFFLGLLTVGFSLASFCIGNLNALAMQPMGHIAGLAASTISAVSTSLGALLSAPATIAFDGTPVPATIGILASALIATLLARGLREMPEALT